MSRQGFKCRLIMIVGTDPESKPRIGRMPHQWHTRIDRRINGKTRHHQTLPHPPQ